MMTGETDFDTFAWSPSLVVGESLSPCCATRLQIVFSVYARFSAWIGGKGTRLFSYRTFID